jgi:hypothetical protein
MPRAPVSSACITRSVKAVASAGVPIGRIEIRPDGTIIIHTVDDPAPGVMLPAAREVNEWDKALDPEGSR